MPQIREYYRLSTTVINAYLEPILARYIAQSRPPPGRSRVKTPQKYIMQSNGGMATFAAAARKAVATVLSGPAGGITASVQTCRTTGLRNLITFDMGGTSCDVALIKDGEPSVQSRGKIEGRDIALPMIDINTVSAGGGTLARVDRFGILEVGPQSAGAVPGPACYGRGGTEPTITDCNVVLGYLGEDNFLGGKMKLDSGAARSAVERACREETRAGRRGRRRRHRPHHRREDAGGDQGDLHHARSRSPRLQLLAFGGAGPLHAARIAKDLGMAGVVVPLYPGVYSAMGLLMSDVKHDYIRSKLSPLSEVDPHEAVAMFERLARRRRSDLKAENFRDDQIGIERALDMRYAGQGYEITIACDDRLDRAGALDRLRGNFDDSTSSMFGHTRARRAGRDRLLPRARDRSVPPVSCRVRAAGRR